MTNVQNGNEPEKRRLESCTCGHGSVWHEEKYGMCTGNITYTPKRCPCKGFELNWYITKSGKFNKFGESIR